MIQNLLLIVMVILCILLIISILKKPFDGVSRNPCKFKILSPKYIKDGNKKKAHFVIIVKKSHRYFINFPLLFKFYSDNQFKSHVKVTYITPEEDKPQLILDKFIEFTSKTKEHIVYITDVIMGKIMIELTLEVEHGKPIIGFEIMKNSTCDLIKEHKLELIFPD